MDDYMFRSYVAKSKCVQEATSYLEIFNYSVSCPVLLLLGSGDGTVLRRALHSAEAAGRRRWPSPDRPEDGKMLSSGRQRGPWRLAAD